MSNQTEQIMSQPTQDSFQKLSNAIGSPYFCLVLDNQGTITYASPSIESVLHLAPDEIVGQKLEHYLHEPLPREIFQVPESQSILDDPISHTLELQLPEGPSKLFEFQFFPRFDPTWNQHLLSVLVREVAAVSQQESVLLQRYRVQRNEQSQLIARLSRVSSIAEHSIAATRSMQQYLNSSLKLVQTLQDAFHDLKLPRKSMIHTAAQLQSLLMQANESLDRVQSSNTMKNSARDLVLIRHLVCEAVTPFLHEIEEADIKIEFDFENEESDVFVDRMIIEQALLLIIENAVESLTSSQTKNPRLIITQRTQLGGMELIISDNGPGLKEISTDEIFELFRSTHEKRQGMGLSVAKSLVESHDGEINATINEWGGLSIQISLP